MIIAYHFGRRGRPAGSITITSTLDPLPLFEHISASMSFVSPPPLRQTLIPLGASLGVYQCAYTSSSIRLSSLNTRLFNQLNLSRYVFTSTQPTGPSPRIMRGFNEDLSKYSCEYYFFRYFPMILLIFHQRQKPGDND